MPHLALHLNNLIIHEENANDKRDVFIYTELKIIYYHGLKTSQSWFKMLAIASFFNTVLSWCFDDRSRSETCDMNSPSWIVLFILLYTVFLVEVSYKNRKLKFSPNPNHNPNLLTQP